MKLFSKFNEYKKFGVLFIVFIFVAFINGVPFIFGDAYGYYHVGSTIAEKGTYPNNEAPDYYRYTGHAVFKNSNGLYVTPYSLGQSILYWPFLTISSIFNGDNLEGNYYTYFNGHTLEDGLAILFAAIFYSFLGIVFTYLFLRQLDFSSKVSFYSTISLFIGLFLISYTFEQPGYSHVYEFFLFAGFLYFFTKFLLGSRSKYIVIASVFASVLVLVRLVDVVLVAIPFLYILYKYRLQKRIFYSLVFPAVAFALLLIYNYLSYGNALTLGYTAGGSSGFALEFNILNLLFSDTRGLLIWSPIVFVSIIGLYFYIKKSKTSVVVFGIPIFLLLLIYNFWGNWWGGVSAGQRFFIVLLPLFVVGIAYFYSIFKFKMVYKIAIFALVAFSFITSILFRVTPINTLNAKYRDTNLSLTTPPSEDYRLTDLYRYHFDLIKSSPSVSSYFSNLTQGLNGGRSLLLLSLGLTDPLVYIEKIDNLAFKVKMIPNNVNTSIKSNIVISLKTDRLERSYLISNVSFKSYSAINVVCSTSLDCSSDNIDLIDVVADSNKARFANISGDLAVSVYGVENKVNYLNLKLK